MIMSCNFHNSHSIAFIQHNFLYSFSVFGLGSSSYPNFSAFAVNVDLMFDRLGGKRLTKIHKGDALGGQEDTFRVWARTVFQVETYFIRNSQKASNHLLFLLFYTS